MAPIFKTIKVLCTVLPERTPRQLMTVKPAKPRRGDEPVRGSGVDNLPKIMREGDRNAAIPPVCITNSSAQP